MEKYRAVRRFVDLQDNKHPYNVGDEYPRKGLSVSRERINELLGVDNKQHRPLITYDLGADEIPFAEKKYTAKQLEAMTIAQIEKIANERDYEINGTLKADIIAEFMEQQM